MVVDVVVSVVVDVNVVIFAAVADFVVVAYVVVVTPIAPDVCVYVVIFLLLLMLLHLVYIQGLMIHSHIDDWRRYYINSFDSIFRVKRNQNPLLRPS